MSEHSPGPWKWDEGHGITDASGRLVIGGQEWACSRGDVPLITAAPELLEVVQELRRNTQFMGIQSGNATCLISPDAVAYLDALIARIEGKE